MKKIFYYNPKTLTFENIKTNTYIKVCGYIVLSFCILFTLGWWTGTNRQIVKYLKIKGNTETLIIHGKPFNEDAFIDLLKDCNMKYPHIVFAQAKLESANFTSKVFRENHNLFGMRRARQRITTAQTEKNTYAYYRDWLDCVYDYCMYQSSVMCNITNEDEYFAKLGSKYAEDSMYVSKLKNIIKTEKLKNIFEE